MKGWRILLGAVGVAAGAFGAVELITGVSASTVLRVAIWLAAAVIIHDAVWSPGLVGVGALLTRVPVRGRRYLQAGLMVAAAITVVALPMIYLQGSQPPSKAILLQNVGANLALLLVIVAVLTLSCYLGRVIRDRRRR